MACPSNSTRRSCPFNAQQPFSFGTLSGSILLAHAHGLHLIHPSRRPKRSRSLVAVVALLVLKHGAF